MKKYTIFGICAIALLLNAACKKTDDSSTTTPSLGGLSINSVPAFLPKNTVLTFQADVSDIVASDGSEHTIGLYWQVNSSTKKDTTTRNIKIENPVFEYSVDTLGVYDVYCYAFTPDNTCYSTSVVASFQAVDPEKVIQGYFGDPTSSKEVIAQDGKTWQIFNVFDAIRGLSFRDSPVLDYLAGRMYNQEEAKTVCPAGMHLPSVADFRASFGQADGTILSAEMMADATFAGDKMWEYWPKVQISNAKHFNAMPLGYIDLTDPFNTYNHYAEYACFWTKDEENGLGKFMYIYADDPEMREGEGDKETLYMSVRCVRD